MDRHGVENEQPHLQEARPPKDARRRELRRVAELELNSGRQDQAKAAALRVLLRLGDQVGVVSRAFQIAVLQAELRGGRWQLVVTLQTLPLRATHRR